MATTPPAKGNVSAGPTESRRPEYKEPGAVGVMASFGGLTCVGGIVCLIGSASEGPALAIIGATAILGGILYFCLSSAFSLLAITAHYTGLACWHLDQLRKELSETRNEPKQSDDEKLASIHKKHDAAAGGDAPYRL